MTVTLLVGDVMRRLRSLPDCCVDMVATSPPYWGQRSYLAADHPDKALEIGLEPTLGEHIDTLLHVFREVRRVLKPSGVAFVNYGDCYATKANGTKAVQTKARGADDRAFRDKPFDTVGPIYAKGEFPKGASHDPTVKPVGGLLKPKDLCLIPARLAIALQDDGWWIRARNVWGKSNPMPDTRGSMRPSIAHEEVLMIAKSPSHFYNADAVALPVSGTAHARLAQDVANQFGSERANGGRKRNGPIKAVRNGYLGSGPKSSVPGSGVKSNTSFNAAVVLPVERRFLRNYEPAPLDVWRINGRPFRDAHFATFPPELVERMILAGCPKGGVVLDPFGGAGTAGLVAEKHGLDSILIELSADYAAIAKRRIEAAVGPCVRVEGLVARKRRRRAA